MTHSTTMELTELPGMGPWIERRLSDADIHTLAELAQADPADLLGRIRVEGLRIARVERWVADARRHQTGGSALASEQGAAGRRESFLVTLLSDTPGGPPRSIVKHVRSEREDVWAGWDPERLVRFIAENAEVGVASAHRAKPEAPAPVELPLAVPAVTDAAEDSPNERRLVTIEAGRVMGGRPRPLEFVLTTDGLATQGLDVFTFDATITAREVGSDDRQQIARLNGSGIANRTLPLRMPAVTIPRGLQRLEIAVSVSPAPADGEAPALRLAAAAR